MWLICGLGNPGPKYAGNRHNIGFMVVDELARRARGADFRAKFGGELAQAEVGGHKALLLKPMEYMNVSGQAVQRTAAFYQVGVKELIVIHDELDLPFGQLRLKIGGGHGGHNGLRSIIGQLGSPEFVRVRCGIGRPGGRMDPADYVLQDFARGEREQVDLLVSEAAAAIDDVLARGPLLAMNRWNQGPGKEKEKEGKGKAGKPAARPDGEGGAARAAGGATPDGASKPAGRPDGAKNP